MFFKSSLQVPNHVRTNRQPRQEVALLNDLKAVLSRSSLTIAEDALGVVALFILLVAGLHLPVFA
jgi:hypothetical protein